MTAPSRLFLFVRRFAALFFAVIILLGNAAPAYAGFGITPPYVNNDRLTRGTVYQQVINLVRSDPSEGLQTDITIDVPGANSWFTIDKGNSFVIPAGQTQVPIIVTVTVPSNAPFQEYTGAIRVRTSPANATSTQTGVSIALGAQINVDIKVVDKIYDFEVRAVRLSDMEEGRWIWGLFFPGKISFYMTIKNTGNTTFGPTKVHFDIYDSQMTTLLESTDNTNGIKQLPAFTTQEVLAELPTHLPAGEYEAKYTIYNNADVAQQGTVSLSISPEGTVIGYQGYGFGGLSIEDKLKVIGAVGVPLLLLILLITILVVKRRDRKRRAAILSR